MNPTPYTPASADDVIEAIVQTLYGDDSSAHARHICRESLRNLVRLAKAEHAQAIQNGMSRPMRTDDGHVLH